MVALEAKNGSNPEYLHSLPFIVNALLGKNGFVATNLKKVIATLASPIVATPQFDSSAKTWASKNAALAAQTLMLAATAHGISSACMEGYDEKRLCSILRIPQDKYSVPMIVSLGYEAESDKPNEVKKKVRFSIPELCYLNTFGHNFTPEKIND